jgi:drug/metabolite transporter (DMT)-like permease
MALGFPIILLYISEIMLGHILLLLSTLIWGVSFVAVKWILPFMPAADINHVRLLLAASVSSIYLIFWWSFKSRKFRLRALANREFWWPPVLCGFLLYLFLTLQTLGLTYTTVAKSGFITCLYVLFIPLILFLFWSKKFSKEFFFYCGLSVFGVYLLMDANFDNFNLGDWLTLGCAFVGAVHIIAVDRLAKEYNPVFFNAMQCLVMGTMSLAAMIWNAEWGDITTKMLELNQLAIFGFIMLGIFSSFFAFTFQVYAQKTIAPHIVAVLFLLESPFAALSGYAFLNETLNAKSILGCLIVLFAAAQVSRISSVGSKI